MKVIYRMKNISNEEFQRCSESRLIEVMTMKMQMIQFVSSVILIQILVEYSVSNQFRLFRGRLPLHPSEDAENMPFRVQIHSQSVYVTVTSAVKLMTWVSRSRRGRGSQAGQNIMQNRLRFSAWDQSS
jgi:hypothetical protein